MPVLTRRSFLAAPVAAAVSRVRVAREERRVVVVGSGFGGGVTALRLARAGVPVLVLERGIRWPTGPDAETFPHVTSPDKRIFWLGSAPSLFGVRGLGFEPYTGLLERVDGHGMSIMCAAGVGGGSLVYQGMTLQPAEDVFNATLPEQLDYARMARVHYPRVAAMLGVATAPDRLVNSPTYAAGRVFARRAAAAGYAVSKIPMPIDWSFALRELQGEMKASYTNGDCGFGVNNGGKHTVDVTYLAQAEATGRVTVATRHDVTDVARARDGRWQVYADVIATDGTVLEKKVLTTRALVLAAGSAGTRRLLVRASRRAGRFVYEPATDDAVLHWPADGDTPLYRRIHERATRIAGSVRASHRHHRPRRPTWHPLGGAAMGTVCDLAGRVLGQRGRYVLDDALIPGTTAACNPSMTIAAVAERATDELIAHDVGRVI